MPTGLTIPCRPSKEQALFANPREYNTQVDTLICPSAGSLLDPPAHDGVLHHSLALSIHSRRLRFAMRWYIVSSSGCSSAAAPSAGCSTAGEPRAASTSDSGGTTTQTQQEVSRTAAWWPGGRGDSAGRLVAQGKVRGVSNQLSASIPV